jgi:hypothetical protein
MLIGPCYRRTNAESLLTLPVASYRRACKHA